jgi:polyribonucleotide nucleotidyltransferase
VLSSDQENDSDVLGIIAASAALSVSDIPFYVPLGGVRVAHVGDKFVAFPTFTELEGNDLNIVVAGTKDSINMVEGGAREISESTMIEALGFAHEWIAKVVSAIDELKGKCGKPKPEIQQPVKDPELLATLTEMALPTIKIANRTTDKLQRQEIINKMVEEVKAALADKFPEKEKEILTIIADFERDDMREMILSEGRRIDGVVVMKSGR